MGDELKGIQAVSEICGPLERYLVCAIRSFNVQDALNAQTIDQMKTAMNEQFQQYGINCNNIDIEAIVQSIRDGSAPTSGPWEPNTGGGNSDMDGFQVCSNDYMSAIMGMGDTQQICGPLRSFMICTFRAF